MVLTDLMWLFNGLVGYQAKFNPSIPTRPWNTHLILPRLTEDNKNESASQSEKFPSVKNYVFN